MTKPRKITARSTRTGSPVRRWHSPFSKPEKDGWYEVLAPDDRWDGQPNWRLWKGGCWWKSCECEGAHFVAYLSECARFQWRGDARPARLTYEQVMALAGAERRDSKGSA
jgi:hypothetical protein